MATISPVSERYELCELLNSPCLPYQPASLSMLVSYLDENIAKNTVKPELCTAILKLFLLYPQCSDAAIIRKILVQGLIGILENDPVLYLCLIPTTGKSTNKKVTEVLALTDLVQSCRFKQVWEMLKEPSMQDVVQTPGMVESLRQFICSIMSLSFHSIALADFTQLLNISTPTTAAFEDRLEKILKANGWVVEEHQSQKNVRIASAAAVAAAATAVKEGAIDGGRRAASAQTAAATHKTVEKYMSPDGLKLCLSTLLKSTSS